MGNVADVRRLAVPAVVGNIMNILEIGNILEKDSVSSHMGCLEFLTDWLFYREGAYHTVPSTSPENMYLSEGRECAVCTSSAMDMELVREFLESALKAMQIAGADSEQRQKVEKYLEQLAPVKLGKDVRNHGVGHAGARDGAGTSPFFSFV